MAQIIKKTNKKGQVSYLIRVSEGYHSDGTQIKRSMTYTPEKGMTARQAEKEAQRQAISRRARQAAAGPVPVRHHRAHAGDVLHRRPLQLRL